MRVLSRRARRPRFGPPRVTWTGGVREWDVEQALPALARLGEHWTDAVVNLHLQAAVAFAEFQGEYERALAAMSAPAPPLRWARRDGVDVR